jgi:hypothetical protein
MFPMFPIVGVRNPDDPASGPKPRTLLSAEIGVWRTGFSAALPTRNDAAVEVSAEASAQSNWLSER